MFGDLSQNIVKDDMATVRSYCSGPVQRRKNSDAVETFSSMLDGGIYKRDICSDAQVSLC